MTMTNQNLTLDNWVEEINKTNSWIGICRGNANRTELIQIIKTLLSLQHQKDIEQFKNMESMKKEKHSCYCLKEDTGAFNCDCGIERVNQKIDEIISELEKL